MRSSLPKIGEGSGGVDVDESLVAGLSRLGRVRVGLIYIDQVSVDDHLVDRR